MQCRVCGSDHVLEVMKLDRVPANVQAMLAEDQLGQVNAVTFRVFQCQQCELVQAPVQLNSHYYDDYLMSTTFSSQLTDYLDNMVEQFVDQFDLQESNVLDVGAGDGAFMYPFRQRGIKVVGIEPSERSRTVATANGFTVYPGYVSKTTDIPGAPFDAFVSRQVLEHVDDIQGFLAGIKRNLQPGAVGIIEVPRLEKAQEDFRFYDFFPDHVNYFSAKTLRTTLELNGFEVLELRSTMFDEYNVAVVKATVPANMSVIEYNRHSLVQAINNLFALYRTQHKTTAIWGAGAKGLSIMANLDQDLIDHLIDSDINKQGRYSAVSELLVEPCEILLSHTVNVIVITAVAYQTTILQKLKDQYDYRGDVYVLQHSGLKKVQL